VRVKQTSMRVIICTLNGARLLLSSPLPYIVVCVAYASSMLAHPGSCWSLTLMSVGGRLLPFFAFSPRLSKMLAKAQRALARTAAAVAANSWLFSQSTRDHVGPRRYLARLRGRLRGRIGGHQRRLRARQAVLVRPILSARGLRAGGARSRRLRLASPATVSSHLSQQPLPASLLSKSL
jgi:hypothetical protein